MITIFYYKLNDLWNEKIFSQHLSKLPLIQQQKILLYKDKKDQQLRLCGKLMLLQLLRDLEVFPENGLNDMTYDEYNKPSFKGNFNFSIAHSDDYVVCAASIQNSVGIDIEKIKSIDVLLLKDFFSKDEWTTIEENNYDTNYFYFLWTRKEAVMKTIGKGVYEEMGKIDVLKDEIIYQAKSYYIQDLSINYSYRIALACNFISTYNIKEFVSP